MRPLLLLAIAICVLGAGAAIGLNVPGIREPLLIVKAQAEVKIGLKKQALDDALDVLKSKPDHCDALMIAASVLEEEGSNQQAAGYFEKLTRFPSTKLLACHHLTVVALSDRDYEKTVKYADEWIALAPNDARPYHAKGSALARLGKEQEAIDVLGKSIELDPNSGAALERDELFSGTKSLEEAAASVMDQKFENNPNDFDALLRDAQRHMLTNEIDSALKSCGDAIKVKKDPSAYGLRGYLELNNKRPAEAAADFAEVEKLAGNHTVKLKSMLPEFHGLSAANQVPVSMEPWEVACNHGTALKRTNDLKGALKYLNKAIALNPNFASAYNERSDLYVTLHDPKRATADQVKYQQLKVAKVKNPFLGAIRDNLKDLPIEP